MIRLLKGFPGKPLHPPLTDASIGSYTLGVAALIAGVIAELMLAVGSNIGGANVFVYGIRVLKRPETPPAKALNPLGVKSDAPDA